MKPRSFIFLVANLFLISCGISQSQFQKNSLKTLDQYFVVAQECFAGESILQGFYTRLNPCEYFKIIGTTYHAGNEYFIIQVDNNNFYVDSSYGKKTNNLGDVETICAEGKKIKHLAYQEYLRTVAKPKHKSGPYLFNMQELTFSDPNRIFEIYFKNEKQTNDYFVLEKDCTYDQTLKFECKDEKNLIARFYVKSLEVPNTFNINEFKHFDSLSESEFFTKLENTERLEQEKKIKAEFEAEQKRIREERARAEAKQKKAIEKKSKLLSDTVEEQQKSTQQISCSYPHVPKKNGIYDERKNDLWELANDWVFFREQILKKTADGDTKGAQKARQDFQQTNAWLSEYPESQVYEAISIAEKCRSRK